MSAATELAAKITTTAYKTRDDVVPYYRVAIAFADPEFDWTVVNKAIIERWSLDALGYIKHKAWTALPEPEFTKPTLPEDD